MTGSTDRATVPLARALRSHAGLTVAVSAIYVWSYFCAAYLVAPLQSALAPWSAMSLLFLPHEVRVLSAWLYGWRSVGYLLPGAMLCNLHFAGDRAFAPDIVIGSLASLVAAPVAFAAVRRATPMIETAPGRTRLAAVVVVGFLASILNLTALKAAYGLAPLEGVVIFVGDASGLLASMLVVWAVLSVLGR